MAAAAAIRHYEVVPLVIVQVPQVIVVVDKT